MSLDPEEIEVALGRLEHMVEAIDAIWRFTSDHDEASFTNDEVVTLAAIAKFTVIGEAARKMPGSITTRYPGVEWRRAVHFRNFLVHVYDQINPAYLWKTIEEDLPSMREELSRIIAELS